jgi:hypothetical protein
MMALAKFFQRLRQLMMLTVFVALTLAVLARAGHHLHMPHLVWHH